MENMLRRFALLCGGNYQRALLLNHLYYEAYEGVGRDKNHTSTIRLEKLSQDLCISSKALEHYFVYLSTSAKLIESETQFSNRKATHITYTVSPLRIIMRLDLSAQEAEKIASQNRRAINLSNPGILTIEQWIGRLNNFGWTCAYCTGKYEVLEHVIPLTFADSGTSLANCVPACQKCNTLKGPYHPDRLPPRVQRKIGKEIAAVRWFLTNGQEGEQVKQLLGNLMVEMSEQFQEVDEDEEIADDNTPEVPRLTNWTQERIRQAREKRKASE